MVTIGSKTVPYMEEIVAGITNIHGNFCGMFLWNVLWGRFAPKELIRDMRGRWQNVFPAWLCMRCKADSTRLIGIEKEIKNG